MWYSVTYSSTSLSRWTFLTSKTRWASNTLFTSAADWSNITTETSRTIFASWARRTRGTSDTLGLSMNMITLQYRPGDNIDKFHLKSLAINSKAATSTVLLVVESWNQKIYWIFFFFFCLLWAGESGKIWWKNIDLSLFGDINCNYKICDKKKPQYFQFKRIICFGCQDLNYI